MKINGPRRSDVINVQRNKVFKEIANIMMSSVVGNCLTDTGSFNVSIAAGKVIPAGAMIYSGEEG